MSEPERELYRALRSLFFYSVLTVVIVVAGMFIAFYWSIHSLIENGKCKCTTEQPKQIHEQHVTVSSPLVEPSVMAAELKRRHEARHNEHVRGFTDTVSGGTSKSGDGSND